MQPGAAQVAAINQIQRVRCLHWEKAHGRQKIGNIAKHGADASTSNVRAQPLAGQRHSVFSAGGPTTQGRLCEDLAPQTHKSLHVNLVAEGVEAYWIGATLARLHELGQCGSTG